MALKAHPTHTSFTPESQLRGIVRKLALLLCVVVVVIVTGTAYYAHVEKIEYIDALYSVVMVMTAIGAGRDPVTKEGKLFNMAVALFSVAMLVSVLTQIGQLMLRREFLNVLQDWRSKSMKNHTIICGTSHTSNELLNRIAHETVIVLVKTSEDVHRVQREHANLAVHACDFTSSKALQQAGIEHAALVIAASESDADNAFTCLTAKHMRKDIKVITRMSRTENREKMQEVGADAIISPAELAADAVMAARAKLVPQTA